ncbi:MAG: GDSL-type esterase/lipase family protein [Phycisphaerales bacterium]
MRRVVLSCAVLFIVENILLCPAAGLFVSKKGGLPWIIRQFREVGAGRNGPEGNLRLSVFEQLPDSPNDIYMVGDSITEMAGDWDRLLGVPDAQNRGIGGDTTAGVLDRLSEIVTGQPQKIFLMVGISDLQGGESVEDALGRYEQIVKTILTRCPQTRVFTQSVLPVNSFLYNQYITPGYPGIHMPTTEEVQVLNRGIAAIAADRVTYIDLWPVLTEDGRLSDSYTYDGLHVNGNGYAAWARSIERWIR